MKNAFKIIGLFAIAASVYLLWPTKSIQPEVKTLAPSKSPGSIQTIILVYNATSDRWSVAKDFFHKIISPKTYPCQLCNLTFGVFTMRKEWKMFLDRLPFKKEFLHKDEFERKYSLDDVDYPVILASDSKGMWIVVSRQAIDSCNKLDELMELTRKKLATQ